MLEIAHLHRSPQPDHAILETLPAERKDRTGTAAEDAAGRIRFDRNELSGAFGDLGTDLPLLVGMVLAAGLDAASVLLVFGALQVASGLAYRMPMPVQPLKAVAVIVIAQQVPAPVLFGGGLAIGVVMLLLAATGALGAIARIVPRAVVRGLQIGLGLQLTILALLTYIPSLGSTGYLLAALSGLIIVALIGNRRWPPAPFVIAAGIAYALTTEVSPAEIAEGFGVALPSLHAPSWREIGAGFVLLAIPQLPLSIGNSVLATRQLAIDLFPGRAPPSVRRIGISYGLMNLVAPLLGGIPACHGAGGMAGHHAHGGRTGGSVVIYGAIFLATGLLLSGAFEQVARVFPLPMLGVLLVVEGAVLMLLARDLCLREATELPLALVVAAIVIIAPYGYLAGMVMGTILYWGGRRIG